MNYIFKSYNLNLIIFWFRNLTDFTLDIWSKYVQGQIILVANETVSNETEMKPKFWSVKKYLISTVEYSLRF